MDFDSEFLGFNILYKLGQGAFSTTYLAEQDDQRIAIKVIKIPNSTTSRNMTPEMLLGKDFQLNLKRTSTVLNDILKNLSDSRERKGILRYYDYQMHLDKETGVYSLAILTEYLDSLNVYGQKNDITVRNILKMGMDLCDGMEYLGRKGVFHGNIKESNIFFDNIKGFKLGDFFFNDALINTLIPDDNYLDYGCRFLAPEAYEDDSLSHQTDVFSLGMLMYKLLNNSNLPYQNEDGDISLKDIRDRFISERILPESKSIHPEIYEFLLKATSFHKGDRYLTFHQMKDDIKTLMSNLPFEVLGRVLEFKPTVLNTDIAGLPTPKSNLEMEHPDLVEKREKEKAYESIATEGTPFEISIDPTKKPPRNRHVGLNEKEFLEDNKRYNTSLEDRSKYSYFDEEEMSEIDKEGSTKNKILTAIVIIIIILLGTGIFLIFPTIETFIKGLFN